MREMKFRGRRVDNGEWVYGNLIGNDVIVGEIVEWDDQYFCTSFWYKVDPETVGQYTGWEDDQKISVYEGDKVLDIFGGKKYTVEWDTCGSGFLFCEEKLSTGIDYYEFEDQCGNLGYRVVGSIHDHLLKGEQA